VQCLTVYLQSQTDRCGGVGFKYNSITDNCHVGQYVTDTIYRKWKKTIFTSAPVVIFSVGATGWWHGRIKYTITKCIPENIETKCTVNKTANKMSSNSILLKFYLKYCYYQVMAGLARGWWRRRLRRRRWGVVWLLQRLQPLRCRDVVTVVTMMRWLWWSTQVNAIYSASSTTDVRRCHTPDESGLFCSVCIPVFSSHFTIMRGKSVCLSVCLSVCQPLLAPSLLHGGWPWPRRLSPWALVTCPPLCPPPICPLGQPEGVGLSCRVFFTRWFCQTRQLSAPYSASWRKTPAHRAGHF